MSYKTTKSGNFMKTMSNIISDGIENKRYSKNGGGDKKYF